MSSVDVAIIGAGAYGVSLAAHLCKRNVEHRIFGPPMHAWASMSPGMYLKSFGFATSLETPDLESTLPAYCLGRNVEDWEPIEIATFTEYGLTVQRKLVPHVETADVTAIDIDAGRFHVTLATG